MALTKVNGNLIQTDTIPEVEALEQSVETIASIEGSTGFKNRIIGGNFSTNPWQRGTSFVGPTTGYTADRFGYESHTGAVNILRTVDAPSVAQAGVLTEYCLHLDVVTADISIGASDYADVFQLIEGYNIADLGFGEAGTRYFTLSFWHKHTKPGTYSVGFRNDDSNRSYVAEYTQSVTDTWEKAELTIPVDTSGVWKRNELVGLRVNFSLAFGSAQSTTPGSWQAGNFIASNNQVNALDSTSNNFKLALVQLEAGEKATKFEYRSISQELTLCQRYYQVGEFLQYAASSSYTYWYYSQIDFITQMRANPTMTNTSGGSPYQTASGNSGVNFTSQSPRRTVTYPSNSAGWHAVSFNYSASAEL